MAAALPQAACIMDAMASAWRVTQRGVTACRVRASEALHENTSMKSSGCHSLQAPHMLPHPSVSDDCQSPPLMDAVDLRSQRARQVTQAVRWRHLPLQDWSISGCKRCRCVK